MSSTGMTYPPSTAGIRTGSSLTDSVFLSASGSTRENFTFAVYSGLLLVFVEGKALIIIIICLFSNLVACAKLQKRPENIQKAAIYATISAKRLCVLLRDQPISTKKSVRIGVLLPSCARAQVISMIYAYSLGKQASHTERS